MSDLAEGKGAWKAIWRQYLTLAARGGALADNRRCGQDGVHSHGEGTHLVCGGDVRIASLPRQRRADGQKESIDEQRANPLTPVGDIASFSNFLKARPSAASFRMSIIIQTALERSLRR